MSQVALVRSLAIALILLTACSTAAAPQADRNTAACMEHLYAIHRALDAYRHRHGRLPDHLSDLVPEVLLDTSRLHCPADPSPGDPDKDYGHKDPKLAVSYSYEMSGDPSYGLASPMGRFPRSDDGSIGWGTCRHVGLYERTFFGDQVPVVRCFHHTRPSRDPDEDNVLNLTLDGKVYRSGWIWENCLPTIDATLQRAGEDLGTGAMHFKRFWYPGALESRMMDWMRTPRVARLRPRLRSVARLFLEHARELGASRTGIKTAAWLYYGAGDYDRAIQYARKAIAEGDVLAHPAGRDDFLIGMLADAYIATGQTAKVIPLYESVLKDRPGNGYFTDRMSEAYALLGQREKAEAWRLKANPIHVLVGRPAPDFRLPAPAGGEIALAEALRGRKALLINFWYYH